MSEVRGRSWEDPMLEGRRPSGVTPLPGASVRNSAHGRGHEEGGFGIRKGGIEPQETPCSWQFFI